ncbi:hypothetical protein Tco_0908147, partial [Tanacetum coccineum]
MSESKSSRQTDSDICRFRQRDPNRGRRRADSDRQMRIQADKSEQ